jgi:pimeloyl-ACP methyl ester carboxylesterase
VEAARLLPGRVAGLVFVDTLLDPDQRIPEADIAQAVESFRTDFVQATRVFGEQYLFAEKTQAAIRQRVLADWAKMPPAAGVAMLEDAWRYDPRPHLSALSVPVASVNADKYPTNAAALARYAPGFQAFIVKGVGHYPMLEAPEEFVARLEEAITRVEAAAGPRR